MSAIDIDLGEFVLPNPTPNPDEIVPPRLLSGYPPTPQQLVLLYSHDDWEEFLKEWGQYQKSQYKLVVRLGGANDYGIDVACFHTENGFLGDWDNFQCKHYGNPIPQKVGIEEVGKALWHIYKGNITVPNNYYFFAPKDCGPSLVKLLLDTSKLRESLYENWDRWCSNSITTKIKIELDGEFRTFVDSFDFSIFKYKSTLSVIEDHAKTPYHVHRFYKLLEGRPQPDMPPDTYDGVEARYIEQLFEAYSENQNTDVTKHNIDDHEANKRHFSRQRESFYYAESLKMFARDSVPPGTFETLQDELLSGVLDICEDDHADGLRRLKEVTKNARSLTFTSNTLHQVMKIQDKQGICHQLANEDKLIWVKKNV